jgi:predicted DNA-binding transcriptional regulator AlpA
MKTKPNRAGVTLAEVRRWPAVVDVADAGRALGIGRASAYEAISRDAFPAKVIRVNRRLRVLTASLVEVLEGRSAA